MSVWRKKAIDCLPNLKYEFEQPETSIYEVFIEVLPALVEAHRQNNKKQLQKIYDFAEWCTKQKEKELWNAAGVCFYEHLGDCDETLQAFTQWIKPAIYSNVRGLLEDRISTEQLKRLDDHYLSKKRFDKYFSKKPVK